MIYLRTIVGDQFLSKSSALPCHPVYPESNLHSLLSQAARDDLFGPCSPGWAVNKPNQNHSRVPLPLFLSLLSYSLARQDCDSTVTP